MKTFHVFLCAAGLLAVSCSGGSSKQPIPADDTSKVVVAYVTAWKEVMPVPAYMTHINYAFGHVNPQSDGIVVSNEERLRRVVALKQQQPQLKVLLSIGGWGSGHFSEMADSDSLRTAFARDCARVVKEFNLDGIDIDWEYPTTSMAGISSSPRDTENFTLLMRDIREAIGTSKELTLATVATARYIDFKAIMPYIDFVNIMAYDMADAPKHHSALYASQHTGSITADSAVKAHLAAGVPPSKLVIGMAFYGRGGNGFPASMNYAQMDSFPQGAVEKWDSVAMIPYYADANDSIVFGFENPHSLAVKCRYIRRHGLRGGMYWEYSGDNARNDLARTVARELLP